MSTDNSPQLEINHHPRCILYVCSVFGITYNTIVSTVRAHTHHLPRAYLYVSILLVKQARHAVRVDTWLYEAMCLRVLRDLTDVTRLNFFEVARAAFFSKY